MTKPISSSSSANQFLLRVAAVLRWHNGEIPHSLRKVVEELEKRAAHVVDRRNVADEFERLLSEKPREEDIHAYIASHPALLDLDSPDSMSNRVAQGLLSKFPISSDRIADFIFLSFASRSQSPNRVDVFELKRADAALFSRHNRLSRDLNDAWMEAVESQRLIALNYKDFVRRALKQLLSKTQKQTRSSVSVVVDDYSRPRITIRILIGRRAALSPEDLMRLRELAFSTNFSIAVVTYDSLLEDLRGRDAHEISRWRW